MIFIRFLPVSLERGYALQVPKVLGGDVLRKFFFKPRLAGHTKDSQPSNLNMK